MIELTVSGIPNSYSYKYCFVKEKGSSIEAIAIGHSQLYDGFQPESFYLPSFNLSNSAQDYTDNYYILRELLPFMPNLKVVILPIGYLNVTDISYDSVLSERSCYYHKYMNLNYDGNLPLKFMFECFNPKKAGKKIISYYLLHSDIVGCDSLGRRNTHNLLNRKEELGNGKLFQVYTSSQTNYDELCVGYEQSLRQTLDMLIEKGIAIVLVSPPYYWKEFKGVNTTQMKFEKDYLAKLCVKYPLHYIDLECDERFSEDDFYDEAHLSEVGAQKFTMIIGDIIKSFL